MEAMFPFGFPRATGFYLVLYVVTLVIHVVFMNYVLAGSLYVAWVSVFTGGESLRRQKTPMASTLRDWLPFALSAAITAGVAPLLFIQVLYQRRFYTANLLLFHRWMLILPVLIVGFYLLYVLKSRRIGGWSGWLRGAVGVGAFLCFAFVAYSWTENHLLSLESDEWVTFYASGSMIYGHVQLLPRLGVWFLGSIPTMTVLLGWQLWAAGRRGESIPSSEPRRSAVLALAGMTAAGLCGAWYFAVADESTRSQMTGPLARPYAVLAVAGVGAQVSGWLVQYRQGRFVAGWLAFCTLGVLGTIAGTAVVREAIRLGAIDVASLFERHADAAQVGGFAVFLIFFAVNAVLICWCILLVKRNARPGPISAGNSAEVRGS